MPQALPKGMGGSEPRQAPRAEGGESQKERRVAARCRAAAQAEAFALEARRRARARLGEGLGLSWMSGLAWFRMYAEFALDPDIQSLAFEDQRHYVVLLCLKCNGTLDKEYATADRRYAVIRRTLGLDSVAIDECKRRLIEAGLIDHHWQPLAWDRRQFLSDSSTERVQRFRERQRNVSVTPPDTESDTDTDTEADKRGERAKRATRLPEDFSLTPERRLVAEAERLPAERVFAKFCDYWRSAAGAKARKHDWDATWRNWCRSEADRSRGNGVPQQPKKTRYEQMQEALQDATEGQ